MQEKYRVQKLVQEVQNVLDAYRSFQRLIPIDNKTPSGLCTATTSSSVQNTNTYNKIHLQQSNKRKNSAAIDAPTIAKKPRGRPPGKKNQVKGLNVLPPLGTQSLIVNSAAGSQVPTTSSIIETQLGTATNKDVTTCNKDVITYCEAVMVGPEEEITKKLSLRPSLISSDSDTEDKRELNCNASHVFLENSIPNGFSIPETERDHSQLDLSDIKFSDLDMEYWSNFSFKDTGIFAEDYFDRPALTQVCPVNYIREISWFSKALCRRCRGSECSTIFEKCGGRKQSAIVGKWATIKQQERVEDYIQEFEVRNNNRGEFCYAIDLLPRNNRQHDGLWGMDILYIHKDIDILEEGLQSDIHDRLPQHDLKDLIRDLQSALIVGEKLAMKR
ncbi:hypothetical protein V8G54_007289 [Vigna mungo]|uniref:Uncharacterized protein n=1 Tax=Vigna mungo TaxID=3915 RepID=A0AAQ3S777_VIGMU